MAIALSTSQVCAARPADLIAILQFHVCDTNNHSSETDLMEGAGRNRRELRLRLGLGLGLGLRFRGRGPCIGGVAVGWGVMGGSRLFENPGWSHRDRQFWGK